VKGKRSTFTIRLLLVATGWRGLVSVSRNLLGR
jgi:hypothetical protein